MLGVNALAQNLSAGPFTAEQAATGRTLYAANCGGCHRADLSGAGEAPALAGTSFMSAWGNRSAGELHDMVKASMPYGNGNSLDAATYTAIVSYMLSANGARPGTSAFTGKEPVKIAAIADGKPPAPGGRRASTPQAAPTPARAAERPATSYPATRFGLTVPGAIKNYQPVTDAMLANPKDGDWLMYRRNYQGWSHSPLKQITTANVKNLQLVWSWAMNDGGASQVTPIIHDGVMFLSNVANTVQALDAKTGELLWENRIGPAAGPRLWRHALAGAVWRQGFRAHHRRQAVCAGRKDRKDRLGNGDRGWQEGYSNTGGAIAVHGKILVGLTYCNRYQTKHCFISAYDANTGKVAWRFKTIALKGEPGGDSWNGLPDEFRQGGETWIAGTYDPEIQHDLLGHGPGQTLDPRHARYRRRAPRSMPMPPWRWIPDTGKLKWFYTHAPGEALDLDEVFERLVIDHGAEKDVLTVGKAGILWKLDRVTGKYKSSAETVFQNVYDKIDPKTGIPTYRADIQNAKVGEWVSSCPGPAGGHDWPATSFDPAKELILIPLHQSCVLLRGNALEKKIGPAATNAASQQLFEMPGTHGNLAGWRPTTPRTMKPVWSLQQKSPFLTSVLTTAGGVGFVGDYRPPFPRHRDGNGQDLVADAADHRRAGPCGELCGGRQAVYRGGNRPGRRQPGGQACHPAAGGAPPRQWQRAVRLRAAG